MSLLVVGGAVFYVATGLALGFEIPRAGGILRTVNVFGWFGDVLFLGVSYVGLVMLLRWLVIDGLWQLWWATFLLPLLAGGSSSSATLSPRSSYSCSSRRATATR